MTRIERPARRLFLLPRPGHVVAAAAALLLCACEHVGTDVKIGPPDLDTTSAAAPKCKPQTYPPNALVRNSRGNAVVRAQVAADGQVLDATLISSAGDRDLDLASVTAVRKFCTFAPAPTGAAGTSDAVRPVDVTVAWDLVPSFNATGDRGVSRIGLRPPGKP
jgi:TonB family protein